MGAKAWFIAYFNDDPKEVLANNPKLDRKASHELAQQLFPDARLIEADDGTLSYLNPEDNELFAGVYGGLSIVAHDELAIDFPFETDPIWLSPSLGQTAYLHVTHSVVDWFAFGLWHNGEIVRILSVSPEDGALEQKGDPLAFEKPYWEGKFRVDDEDDPDPYPLPFHPLDLAEASLLHHLGFEFEGKPSDWVCDPEEVPIATFKITQHA